MMTLAPINDPECHQIADLRRILEPQMEKQQDMDDGYFLRWLRSKGGRFDEAADVRGGGRGIA
jgi:hypothetical protein